MSWLTRYKLKLYLQNSLWFWPTVSIFAGIAAVMLLGRIERSLGLEANVSADNARTILSGLAGSLFALVVLVTSAVLLAVQLSSAQLTPRIIGFIYRDPFRKFVLSSFAFTFTFSVGALARIEDSVPLLTAYIASYGFLVNLALFLLFIDSIGKAIRPSSILNNIADVGIDVIKDVYPREFEDGNIRPREETAVTPEEPDRVVLNEIDGVVLAFDLEGLLSLAEQYNCVIELVPEVGDFVAADDPLFHIYRGGNGLTSDAVRDYVAIGIERNLEQDPMFAFRIMVDIASKALSPAINDPTTAVLALDRIQHLLREVGKRYLAEGRASDAQGRIRVIYTTPNWEDFVHLACTEIRQYGRDSMQVMRRLRAMLQSLIHTLPSVRTGKLVLELELLDNSLKRMFPDHQDQTLAETGDFQGLGGSREAHVNRLVRREQSAASLKYRVADTSRLTST